MRKIGVTFILLIILPFVVFGEEVYRVKKGDKLWDIAEKFYGSSQYWYFIWERNKRYIKNPHWIYPGMKIFLPDRSVIAKGLPESEKKYADKLRLRKPILDFDEVVGSIYYSDTVNKKGVIIEDPDGKTLFGGSVTLFARLEAGNFERGDLFRVVGVVNLDGGYILIPKAIVQLEDLVSSGNEKVAIMEVVKNYRDIEAGDRLLPFDDINPIYELKECKGSGKIIYFEDSHDISMRGDRVVIKFESPVEAGCIFDLCGLHGMYRATVVTLQSGAKVGAIIMESNSEVTGDNLVAEHGRCR